LKVCLPDYMVPARIVVLDRLPHLPSGKLDRRALPAPDWEDQRLILPRTGTERRLAEIWAQLLRVEQVGITTSFYELGGHSLLLTQLVSRVRSTFGVEISLAQLFEEMTIRGMAARIDAMASAATEGELDLMADILDELEQVT
jgi:acyl carrier protein